MILQHDTLRHHPQPRLRFSLQPRILDKGPPAPRLLSARLNYAFAPWLFFLFFFYFLSPFSRLAAAFEHHYHMPSMITREGREAPRQIRGVLLDLMELGDAVLSFAGGPG